jgi:uncharacterized protein
MNGGMDRPVAHYFGPADQLFGVYHAATAPAVTHSAVLLCAPLGQEQIRTHRLYRQLATTLAKQGTPCLRFDYFGCGDSAGSSSERDWLRCKADIGAAAAQLRQLSGQSTVVAVGARLGATLALESAATAELDALILWDPVVDVAAMVERMDALQQRLLRDPERFLTPRTSNTSQWLGFAVSEPLRAQLLAAHPVTSPVHTLWLHSSDNTAIADNPQAVTLLHPAAWEDLDRLELATLSHELVQAVCQWIGEMR